MSGQDPLESQNHYFVRKIKRHCSENSARLSVWLRDEMFFHEIILMDQQGFAFTDDLVLSIMRKVYAQREEAWNTKGIKFPISVETMRRSIRFLERATFNAHQDSQPEYNSSSAV